MAQTTNKSVPFSDTAASVLEHITKVKLERQEKIFALLTKLKLLTKQNQDKAVELVDLDNDLQSLQVSHYLLCNVYIYDG